MPKSAHILLSFGTTDRILFRESVEGGYSTPMAREESPNHHRNGDGVGPDQSDASTQPPNGAFHCCKSLRCNAVWYRDTSLIESNLSSEDHHMALGLVLLNGPRGGLFLMSEVPLPVGVAEPLMVNREFVF
jgi:hypothetical protein